MSKLPKTIYVTADLNSDDLLGLLAWRRLFDAADDAAGDYEQTVGVYHLVETKRVKKVVSVR